MVQHTYYFLCVCSNNTNAVAYQHFLAYCYAYCRNKWAALSHCYWRVSISSWNAIILFIFLSFIFFFLLREKVQNRGVTLLRSLAYYQDKCAMLRLSIHSTNLAYVIASFCRVTMPLFPCRMNSLSCLRCRFILPKCQPKCAVSSFFCEIFLQVYQN